MKYKVYQFNDFDWVACTDFEEGVKWYMEFTGLDREEALDEAFKPYEQERMPNYVILERYGNEDLEKEYLEDEEDNTMRVPADIVLERENRKESGKPFIFCSTEY